MTRVVGLCLLWGFQQVAMKFVAGEIDTVLQVALRSAVAALLVWLYSRFWRRDAWVRGQGLRAGLLVGLLFGVEYLFVGEGLRRTSAAHMSVFLYTAPVFAAIGLHLALPEERLSPLQWLGIALAFLGIVAMFVGREMLAVPASFTSGSVSGDLMGLAAGAAWGLTTVVVRTTRLSEAPFAQTLFYQLLGGATLAAPWVAIAGRTEVTASAAVMLSLFYQTFIVCFASYLVWFSLLRRYLASRLGVLSLLSPVFGIFLGVTILGEQLDGFFIIGTILVLVGLMIVGWRDRPRARRLSAKANADRS